MNYLIRGGVHGGYPPSKRTPPSALLLASTIIWQEPLPISLAIYLGEITGSKLTLNHIRAKLLYFIKTVDPTSVPAGHDVSNVATSVNYFELWTLRTYATIQGGNHP